MKTKDNLLKGIIIGVCVVVVPLLTIGSTLDEGEVGTFQISTTMGDNYDLWETIINTRTGEVVKRGRYDKRDGYYPQIAEID